AVTGHLMLNLPAEGVSLFFSTGSGWGTLAQTNGALTLHLRGGRLTLLSITVGDCVRSFESPRTLAAGQSLNLG
ncbi:MAG: hypothetical protein M3Y28_03730, partial [Armatimonadota bacterium]|nr:hypothetical protein [Armatimonadota bacterium]